LGNLVKKAHGSIIQDIESSWKAIEPSLRFEYQFSSENGTLKVSLGYDFLPPTSLNDENYAKRVIIPSEQIEAEISRFATDLEEELTRFPIRGTKIAK
jgi:hypothetical protein